MAVQRAARAILGKEELTAEVVRVVHETLRPDPLFKLTLKTGAKGQVQWEIEQSGTDPAAVQRIICNAHETLLSLYGTPSE